MARQPRLVLTLSARADQDLRETWSWNADRNDEIQADEYLAFLYSTMEKLSNDPIMGRAVPGHPTIRQLIMKRRPSGHGHIAFYRVEGEAVQIIRVLHTARNWPELLDD